MLKFKVKTLSMQKRSSAIKLLLQYFPTVNKFNPCVYIYFVRKICEVSNLLIDGPL